MAATTSQNSLLNMSNLSTPTQTEFNHVENREFNHVENWVILAINCVVLIIGFVGLSQVWQIIYSAQNKCTTTIIAVHNLFFAHFVFLLTVPFRIYYYASGRWYLTAPFCKVVSSMIFIHMYMSFIFYVIIVVTRDPRLKLYLQFDLMWPMPVACVLVWLAILVAVPCVVYFKYASTHVDDSKCFNFGARITKEMGAMAFNYVTGLLIVGATLVLLVWQTVEQVKDTGGTEKQKRKTYVFVLIMAMCFLPYNVFRLYYIEHLEQARLQFINEVFLNLTTLNCVDMLTFVRLRFRRPTCCDCVTPRASPGATRPPQNPPPCPLYVNRL